MSSDLYKAQAERLAEHLATTFGWNLKHHAALNAVAALHGARNWNTLVARESAPEQGISAASAPRPLTGLLAQWAGTPSTHAVLGTLVQQRIRHFQDMPAADDSDSAAGRTAGGLLGATPQGTLTAVDVHQPHGSHVAVIGMPGTGKTVLLHELMCDTLRRGGTVHALSIGLEHQSLCQLLGGAHLQLDSARPLGLNPFSVCAPEAFATELKPALIEMLVELLSSYVSCASWFTQTPRELIGSALQAVWERNAQRTTFLLVLGRLAECRHPVVQEASRRALASWDMLGPWLDDSAPELGAALRNTLAVFDIEGLRHPYLQRCVAALVAVHSAMAWWLLPRNAPKLFVIDDADQVLRGHRSQRLWSLAQRRFWRLGGGTATSVLEAPGKDDGSALQPLVSQATTMLLLRQSSGQAQRCAALTVCHDADEVATTVRTLRSGPDGTEVLVLQSDSPAVRLRLELDRYSLLLLSNRAEELLDKRALNGTAEVIDAGLRRLARIS